MLKNITIAKRKEVKAATHPTHDIVASDEKYENKTVIGAMWTRVAKDNEGNDYKFLSGTLSKLRTHEGKEYDGYVIITEKEWDEYKNLKNIVKTQEISNKVKVGGYEGAVSPNYEAGEVNLDDIPF